MTNNETILDVSEFEAPYPLIKGIEAVRNLKDGDEIIFIHRMPPCKLFDQIEKFGCKYEILKEEDNDFKMRIYK